MLEFKVVLYFEDTEYIRLCYTCPLNPTEMHKQQDFDRNIQSNCVKVRAFHRRSQLVANYRK